MRWRTGPIVVLVCCLTVVPLAADEPRSLALSAGAFNFTKQDTAAEGGIEFRSPIGRWGLAAAVGLFGTEDGAVWGFAGLRRDVELGSGWLLTPAFGVALYDEGDGKDLGGLVEFRSGIELGHQWRSGRRLALALYHLSNAGIYDLNPGSNSLILTFSWPLD